MATFKSVSETKIPAIRAVDLPRLKYVCRLGEAGYELAQVPWLKTWLIVSPVGTVILADEYGQAFSTPAQASAYAARQRESVELAAKVRAFDEAFATAA